MTALCSSVMWDGDKSLPRLPWDRKVAKSGPGRPLKVREKRRRVFAFGRIRCCGAVEGLRISVVAVRFPFLIPSCPLLRLHDVFRSWPSLSYFPPLLFLFCPSYDAQPAKTCFCGRSASSSQTTGSSLARPSPELSTRRPRDSGQRGTRWCPSSPRLRGGRYICGTKAGWGRRLRFVSAENHVIFLSCLCVVDGVNAAEPGTAAQPGEERVFNAVKALLYIRTCGGVGWCSLASCRS